MCMDTLRSVLNAFACLALAASAAAAQGVVVDQGQFSVSVAGQRVGTEDFTIRRAGFGRDDAIFANGVVSLTGEGGPQEIRPLLRAVPPDGVVAGYQVEVVGQDGLELQLTRAGRRYVAVLRSALGEEDREFQARADTRILDRDVAHHYYFLKDIREGGTAHALEPRSRSQTNLTAGPSVEEDLLLGRNVVTARRVEFDASGDLRIVWFDRLGRVLRVEIPARDYVAERLDLVG